MAVLRSSRIVETQVEAAGDLFEMGDAEGEIVDGFAMGLFEAGPGFEGGDQVADGIRVEFVFVAGLL